ncbi:MAG: hemerythrin domain-containing protein [Nitrosomonadales bacterium]|nr:hemerythrin domain-containing protein [Nitrosomonadales bacterium]
MKRSPALRKLSNEHHHGLVLAKRARKAAGTEDAQRAWQEIRARFATELEPHFLAEESGLLPALERAGATDLVQRTLAEHAALRRLIGENGAQSMTGFAELLEQHIRFEERELFEAAQQKLSPEEIGKLAH